MYVVLTSKPGEYRTEAGEGTTILNQYEYHFYGKIKAIFSIASIVDNARVSIIEEGENGTVNNIPTTQMEKFSSEQEAYDELNELTQFGSIKAELKPYTV